MLQKISMVMQDFGYKYSFSIFPAFNLHFIKIHDRMGEIV